MRSVCSQLTSSSLSCGRFLNGLCGMLNVLSNSGGEESVFGCRFSPHDGGDEWSLAGTRLFHWFGRENDLGGSFWVPRGVRPSYDLWFVLDCARRVCELR